MLNNGLLTTAVDEAQSSSASSDGVMTYEARAAQSELVHHRYMSLVAARIGLLARDLRQGNAQQSNVFGASTEFMRRKQRIDELRDMLRRTWHAQVSASEALGYSNHHVPIESRGVFEHVRENSLPSAPDRVNLLQTNPRDGELTSRAVIRPVSRMHHILFHQHVGNSTI